HRQPGLQLPVGPEYSSPARGVRRKKAKHASPRRTPPGLQAGRPGAERGWGGARRARNPSTIQRTDHAAPVRQRGVFLSFYREREKVPNGRMRVEGVESSGLTTPRAPLFRTCV